MPTPTGGDWSDLKRLITDALQNGRYAAADGIVGGTLRAASGFGQTSTAAGGGGGGGGDGGGGVRTVGGRASVGRAVSGLGAFGTALRDRGLDAALDGLGLADLHGRPAAEVIARIAEHLTDGLPGV